MRLERLKSGKEGPAYIGSFPPWADGNELRVRR